MSPEFFCPVEQITVGGKLSALEYIAQPLGHVEHFRVEITDPLHFVFGVPGFFYSFIRFHNQVGIHALALEFGNNAKSNACKFFAGLSSFHPEKFQFVQEVELTVQVFEPLVQVGQIHKNCNGLYMVVGKPDDLFVHHRFHFFEHLDHLLFFDLLSSMT